MTGFDPIAQGVSIHPSEEDAAKMLDAARRGLPILFEYDGTIQILDTRPAPAPTAIQQKIALMRGIFASAGVTFRQYRNSAFASADGKEIAATILSPINPASGTESWSYNLRDRADADRVYLLPMPAEGQADTPVAVFDKDGMAALRATHHVSPDGLMTLRLFKADGRLYEQSGRSERTDVTDNVEHGDAILLAAIGRDGKTAAAGR